MNKIDEEYHKRREITFAQAEGVDPLPAQLNKENITRALRAKLWNLLSTHFTIENDRITGVSRFSHPYGTIYREAWINYFYKMVEDYRNFDANDIRRIYFRPIFEKGGYVEIFGFLQYLIRHPYCPDKFIEQLQEMLVTERAAFRIVNGDTFLPAGSPQEIGAFEDALSAVQRAGYKGAQSHLLEAARNASAGAFADSVRESIHAVESVARCLSSKDGLGGALAVLESKRVIHRAMKIGFSALYGYTSDEKGIRHPLLDGGDAAVNEADALFMLGACASFVSYMISRAREAGLFSDDDA